MDGKTLIEALNATNFKAFPCRNDNSKITMSFLGTDNKRYFVTRVATTTIDDNGRPIYAWATGKAMRDITQ